MAEGSVYSNFVNMFREEGYNKDIFIRVGKVTSIKPFKIKLNGYEIEEEDIFLSDSVKYLLDNYNEPKYKIITSLAESTGAPIAMKTEHKPLDIGDKILVLVEDSDFYVIDRVV